MVHPLDGLLACLGAIGFILSLFGGIFTLGTVLGDPESYKESPPDIVWVPIVGIVILIIVIILAFINMILPATI